MIQAQGLTKKYGNLNAIENVSFQIHLGEVVGLLGPNGAGKTTTMRILTGCTPPTSGKVTIAGHDLLEEPQKAKTKLGYLPENPPLYPELTVEEMLSFTAGLRKIIKYQKKDQKKEKVDKVLEKTGLTSVRKRLIGNLSKGYRQRVGIAQAILHEPPFVILDEPTIGLDPKQISEIRELIQTLKGERSILLSSHILQEVSLVCDRVLIIHHGKIVADGKISELTGSLQKKKLLVTVSKDMAEMKRQIAGLSGVESVTEHATDLEDLFLKLTGDFT